MPKILVTGATGFIGSHLCKRLVKDGYQVIGLSLSGDTSRLGELNGNDKFSLRIVDIRDEKELRRILFPDNINTVFHLASQVPYSRYEEDLHNVNSNGTFNLVSIAKKAGVKKFVYASSMSVYSTPYYVPVKEDHPTRPDDLYGTTKLIGEMYCRSMIGMKSIILRYAGVYGKFSDPNRVVSSFVRNALENKPLMVDGKGLHSSDFVYIGDVINGTILAWEKGKSGTYNIGSGEETTLMDLAKKVVEVTHSKSEIFTTERKVARPFRFYLDITKARKELGYDALSLTDGLRSYAESVISEHI